MGRPNTTMGELIQRQIGVVIPKAQTKGSNTRSITERNHGEPPKPSQTHAASNLRLPSVQHPSILSNWKHKHLITKIWEHKAGTSSQLEADDEAEISAPSLDTYTKNPTPTSAYDSDCNLSSQSFNSFLPLPWHDDPSPPIDSPAMVETSKWTKFTMMKACKVLGVNVSRFEHEILDIILRMEEKRKAQILEQRKKSGNMKKGKSKATNELKKLDWGLKDGSGKKDRGRHHKVHSR